MIYRYMYKENISKHLIDLGFKEIVGKTDNLMLTDCYDKRLLHQIHLYGDHLEYQEHVDTGNGLIWLCEVWLGYSTLRMMADGNTLILSDETANIYIPLKEA